MTFPLALLLTALSAQTPQADSLRRLARSAPEAELVGYARDGPLVLREALAEALVRDELDVARRLAAANALAWRDSFLVREVARFQGWAPARRASKVWADSVRRAGVTAYGRDGAAAAIAMWRRALARAGSIGDSAGVGAVLGNIGAGLLAEGELDSAATYLDRSLTLANRIGDIRVAANALVSLAGLRAAPAPRRCTSGSEIPVGWPPTGTTWVCWRRISATWTKPAGSSRKRSPSTGRTAGTR
jgi:hypothetical protein